MQVGVCVSLRLLVASFLQGARGIVVNGEWKCVCVIHSDFM